jgi:HK97 family phage major capsid protein
MSDNLKSKLQEVTDDLSELRKERAEKLKARDEAREAFVAAPGYDMESDVYKAAHAAVKAVGELDDKIADIQSVEVGILKMMGNETPVAPTYKRDDVDSEREEWNAKALLESDMAKGLEPFANSRSRRIGEVSLGQLASREAFKAVTVTAKQRQGADYGILAELNRRLSILDLIPTGSTNGNEVPYSLEDWTDAAAEVTEGNAKPEASISFTDASSTVRTIAQFVKLPKQILADVTALESTLNTRLAFGVRRRLEDQIIAGNGTTPNLRGILSTVGIGTTSYSGTATVADQVYASMLDVQVAEGNVDAIVMNPVDWATVRLSREGSGATSGGYLFGSPAQQITPTIFGVPVVVSNGLAAGAVLVGDFSMGAQLWIRSGLEVLVSDSDQDDFIKNKVTILAEMRAAFAVVRPTMFSVVDLTP